MPKHGDLGMPGHRSREVIERVVQEPTLDIVQVGEANERRAPDGPRRQARDEAQDDDAHRRRQRRADNARPHHLEGHTAGELDGERQPGVEDQQRDRRPRQHGSECDAVLRCSRHGWLWSRNHTAWLPHQTSAGVTRPAVDC